MRKKLATIVSPQWGKEATRVGDILQEVQALRQKSWALKDKKGN
jgi:hypothetical protein